MLPTTVEVCAIFQSPDMPLKFTVDATGVRGPTTYRIKLYNKDGDVVGYKQESADDVKQKLINKYFPNQGA